VWRQTDQIIKIVYTVCNGCVYAGAVYAGAVYAGAVYAGAVYAGAVIHVDSDTSYSCSMSKDTQHSVV